jgi:tight adherence protein B
VRRKSALEAQIPDTVLLVSSALKSGYSFLKALQVVAKEMPAPMSEVTRRVVEECQFGVPMEDALVRMAERARSYDLDLVATAVIIQSQVGGSLAEVLDSIAETIRERIQIEAEVSALTAEGRISGIVLVLMAPVMAAALSFLNPAYMRVMLTDPLGIRLIVGTVVLQILGIVIIKRMMKVEV